MEAGERRSGEMTFYVVRHGQTLFNVMGKVQGWCDTPLTDEGVRAAQSLGRGLAEVDFSAAYSSDSGRAVHTLDELLRARGSKVPFGPYDDMRLREWCYGDLEGEPGELLHATLDAGFGAPLSFEEHNRRLPEVADDDRRWTAAAGRGCGLLRPRRALRCHRAAPARVLPRGRR